MYEILTKKHKHQSNAMPELDRVDKLADDVKELKSLMNLVISKLESKRK